MLEHIELKMSHFYLCRPADWRPPGEAVRSGRWWRPRVVSNRHYAQNISFLKITSGKTKWTAFLVHVADWFHVVKFKSVHWKHSAENRRSQSWTLRPTVAHDPVNRQNQKGTCQKYVSPAESWLVLLPLTIRASMTCPSIKRFVSPQRWETCRDFWVTGAEDQNQWSRGRAFPRRRWTWLLQSIWLQHSEMSSLGSDQRFCRNTTKDMLLSEHVSETTNECGPSPHNFTWTLIKV